MLEIKQSCKTHENLFHKFLFNIHNLITTKYVDIVTIHEYSRNMNIIIYHTYGLVRQYFENSTFKNV